MIVATKALVKSYQSPSGQEIRVLNAIDFTAQKGQTIAITGSSGSGKTTLLSLLAGLDAPTSGEIKVGGKDLAGMDENQLTRFRAEQIGFVFQSYYLLPHFTALENVSLPLDMLGRRQSEETAAAVLEQVGLQERLDAMPSKLSGGEAQRVAIARAMVTRPALILADEPTGSLDVETGDRVTKLLFDLVKRRGLTMILVTHNLELARRCDLSLKLVAGQLA